MGMPPREDGRNPATVAKTKYRKNNYKRVPLDVNQDYYNDVLLPAAEEAGMSMRAYILQAVENQIQAQKKEGP